MAYKFQVGEARLSGSLVREGDVIFKDNLGAGIMLELENDGDVNVYQHNGADKGLKLGDTLVTSTAAELNLVDGSSAATVVASKAVIYGGSGQILGASLYVNDNGYLGNASVNDLVQLQADGDIIIKNGAYDFDIASHDGTNGLLLGGVLVEASAAELNLVDSAQGGVVVNDRAVIYSGAGKVAATSMSSSTGITGSSLVVGLAGTTGFSVNNLGGVSMVSMVDNWTNAGITIADLGTVSAATSITATDLIGTNVDGIIGADTARAASFTTIGASGLSSLASISLDDGSTLGPDSVADLVTFAADGDITVKNGAYDFDIASHDGTNGLKLGGVLIDASAQEINVLDTAVGNTVVNDKAVIYGGAGQIAATSVAVSAGAVFNGDVDLGNATSDTITATGRFDSALVPSSDSARDLGTSALRWSTIYVDSIVGADIAADTEKYGAVPLGYTLSASVDFALLSTATQTYTLPAASAGKKIDIKLSGSIHTCTVAAASGDSIEGGASVILESTGSAISLVAMDATHWFIV
jgi:hypothetical protein|tara:strand:+ start:509 stop:2086 length:1578 start_codon:yes stop_codon:yes gene_type:complete